MSVGSEIMSDPLADPIMEIGLGIFKGGVVCLALKLGIFDQIHSLNNKATAEILASKFGYKPEIITRLLNALVCYGLLLKSSNKEPYTYINSKSVEKYLLKTVTPSLAGKLIGDRIIIDHVMANFTSKLFKGTDEKGYNDVLYKVFGKVENVETGVKSLIDNFEKKTDLNTDQNDNPVSPTKEMNGSKMPNARDFLIQMDAMLCPVAQAITHAFDMSSYKTLLDVGGGSGFLAFEFVKTYPNMKAIVYEKTETVTIAKNLQPAHTKSKVQFVSGDFFKDEKLPEADFILLSHVVHNWGMEKLDILLKKVYDALLPGGCLMVVEKVLNDDKLGSEVSIQLDVVMVGVCNGKERSLSEYEKLLNHHGFQNFRGKIISGINFSDVLISHKPPLKK